MAIIKRVTQDALLPKQTELYADFLTDFDMHPVKKDVVRYINENAVKQSIKNLILTNRGDRLFNNTLGCDIRSMLFEQMSASNDEVIMDLIRSTIENYEPRARIMDINVTSDYDTNTVNVTIVFSIINKQEPITLELILNRIR